MMQSLVAEKLRSKRRSESIQSREPAALQNEPVHSRPVSPPDDIQTRISERAYQLYVERGYRQGYALEDWLEAEREVLGLECKA
jgi:hypothetical protein